MRSVIFPINLVNLAGKSVLDVGCAHGFYCREAKCNGAGRVVGIDINVNRCIIAKKDNKNIDILCGDIMTTKIDGKFDIVLLLNVLHHVTDPIAIMRRLTDLCCDTIVVEFCLPTHSLTRHIPKSKIFKFVWAKIKETKRKLLIRLLGDQPLIILGNIPYHRTFYFSTEAFKNIFMVHNKLFSEIEFKRSTKNKHRMLAFCKINKQNNNTKKGKLF